MTAQKPRPINHNPRSPSRRGPNCETKRARASYARYVAKGRKEHPHG